MLNLSKDTHDCELNDLLMFPLLFCGSSCRSSVLTVMGEAETCPNVFKDIVEWTELGKDWLDSDMAAVENLLINPRTFTVSLEEFWLWASLASSLANWPASKPPATPSPAASPAPALLL